MKVSVILSTFNRGDLLQRSLFSYSNQTLSKDEYEIIVIDDQSTDDTDRIVLDQKKGLSLIYIKIKGVKTGFRSQSAGWNIGLKHAIGDVCFFSHPEIIMPFSALEEMFLPHLKYPKPTFLTMKPYVLSAAAQAKIDSVDWKSDPANIKKIPEFNDSWIDGGRTYTNLYMEKLDKWESNTTFSMKRLDMLGIGGFDEFDCWGPDDPSLRDRRRVLGIPTVISPLMGYHQNHDNLSSNIDRNNYKIKRYFFPSSAKIRMNDHFGEYEREYSYRVL